MKVLLCPLVFAALGLWIGAALTRRTGDLAVGITSGIMIPTLMLAIVLACRVYEDPDERGSDGR